MEVSEYNEVRALKAMNKYRNRSFCIEKPIWAIANALLLVILVTSCKRPTDEKPVKVLDEHTLNRRVDRSTVDPLTKQVYVPIYSDIYNQTRILEHY
ncbi:hypothetical protein [Zobellia laminariae]|uniref:hypothetical protein n=1 Tax=Zobellia laminariae TaxID=248906 RepID=UPI0026F41B91|nr:hypothetical protein [Zobellia laminariae]WKX75347.1 hypothetical protein Q5W13_16890 [Zobellia laminariae]